MRIFIRSIFNFLWSDDLSWSSYLGILGRTFSSYLPWIIVIEIPLCYFVTYFLVPKFLWKNQYRTFTLTLIGCMAADLLISMLYVYVVFHKKPSDIGFSYVFTFLQTFFIEGSGMACFIFLTIKLYKTMYLKEEEKQILIKANAAAEMDLLNAQIHPHFLFNTLNNIYSYVINNRPEAAGLVVKLSDTMNYMIEDCDVSLVPVEKEIKMIMDYIGLEKVRYGERLELQVDITGELSDRQIAPLLMIPFIENSFKHGTSKMLRNAWIKLFIQADENILHFSLTNSKPVNANQSGNRGIGLKNVKKRLELLYPNDHLLVVDSTEHTFTVNMQVPLEKIKKEVVA